MSKRSSVATGGGTNPLQNDEKLQVLMGQLDALQSGDNFITWRKSFVDRLEDFLGDPKGVEKARQGNETIASKMPRLDKAIANVETNSIVDGALKPGVKSQMALNKLKEGCIDMEKRLTKLVPSNSADISACGYTKWQLGAVVVKDGFKIYQDMMHQELMLQTILPVLEEANVDRQTLEIVRNYFNRIRIMKDVLADLGLYIVMMKQREFFPDERVEQRKAKQQAAGGGAAPVEEEYVPPNAMVAPPPAPPTATTDPEPAATSEQAPEDASTPAEAAQDTASAAPAPKQEPAPAANGAPPAASASEAPPPATAPKEPEPTPEQAPPKRGSDSVVPTMVKEKERRQTITITTTNKQPMPIAGDKPKGRTIKRKIQKCKSMDNDPDDDKEPDLARTAKPKARAILPGSGGGSRGRGTGRTLSKEEAKEKRLANPYDKKKKKPPQRHQSAPLPSRQKKKPNDAPEEEEPQQDDGDPDDQNKDNGKDNNKPAAAAKRSSKGAAPGAKGPQAAAGRKAPPSKAANGAAPGAGARKPGTAKSPNGAAAAAKANNNNKVPIIVHQPMMGNSKVELQVDPKKDTVGDVKQQLQEKTGMPIENQLVSGKWSGLEYTVDEKALHFFGIKEGSELDLDPQTLEIQAKVMPQGGKVVSIQVQPKSTCKDVKELVAQQTKLEASQQELYYNGDEWSDTKKTVKLLGMQEGSMVTVEQYSKVPIGVKIMDQPKAIPLLVDLNKDGLADIKQVLKKKTGVAVDNQVLFLPENTELVDKKDKKLAAFGVQKDSELYMEPKIIKITVELPGGKTKKLKVTFQSDMSEIIQALVKTGVKTGKHVFKFQGQEFPTKGKTVKDMGLRDGSKVKLDLTE